MSSHWELSMAAVARAQSFLNSIGVCTHLSYTDGGYNNTRNVINDLSYLGVKNVRDSLVRSSHLAAFQAVAASGVKFTLNVGTGAQTTATLKNTLGLADALNTAVRGSVAAIEGLNEINNWSASYNGVCGLLGAVDLQRDLFCDVHNDAALAGVAVDYFTGYGAGGIAVGPNPLCAGGLADFNTQHPYPVNGAAPAAFMNPAHCLNNAAGAVGPVVYTETGYSSNGGVNGAVNQDVQAQYTLDLLCDAFKDGVQTTYLYDLLDAYAPGSKQGDDGFGLFDSNNAPKEVALGIHDLTTLLADPGATATTFATAPLNVKVSGLDCFGNSLTLEKSSGAFDVLVWEEPSLWIQNKGIERAIAPRTAVVNLGATFQSVEVFDPLIGTSPIATLHNVSAVSVSLTAHPLLVEAFGQTIASAHV